MRYKSNNMEKSENKLPTLANLYEENIELAFKNDQFNLLMNQNPAINWIKTNKYANDSKYIPIGIIETLLQKIFKKYRIEILREGVAFNSVYVVVRLHYIDLISNEWQYYDGIGAVQLQTKSGASPAQLESINNNAVMMAFPMAKSYAIKDAAEHIGKLFGRDLNRKDVLEFKTDKSMSIENINDKKEKIRIIEFIKNATESKNLRNAITEDVLEKYSLIELYELKLSKLEENEL